VRSGLDHVHVLVVVHFVDHVELLVQGKRLRRTDQHSRAECGRLRIFGTPGVGSGGGGVGVPVEDVRAHDVVEHTVGHALQHEEDGVVRLVVAQQPDHVRHVDGQQRLARAPEDERGLLQHLHDHLLLLVVVVLEAHKENLVGQDVRDAIPTEVGHTPQKIQMGNLANAG
jgi:hypothetical protein